MVNRGRTFGILLTRNYPIIGVRALFLVIFGLHNYKEGTHVKFYWNEIKFMFPCNKFQCKLSNFQPANQGKCVRIYLTVILLCQTYLPPGKDAKTATRDDLTCKITYCSTGMLSLALSLSPSVGSDICYIFGVNFSEPWRLGARDSASCDLQERISKVP